MHWTDNLRNVITDTCLVLVNVGTGLAKVQPYFKTRGEPRLDRLQMSGHQLKVA